MNRMAKAPMNHLQRKMSMIRRRQAAQVFQQILPLARGSLQEAAEWDTSSQEWDLQSSDRVARERSVSRRKPASHPLRTVPPKHTPVIWQNADPVHSAATQIETRRVDFSLHEDVRKCAPAGQVCCTQPRYPRPDIRPSVPREGARTRGCADARVRGETEWVERGSTNQCVRASSCAIMGRQCSFSRPHAVDVDIATPIAACAVLRRAV